MTQNETLSVNEQAEAICRWGAARAGVIVVTPILGSVALLANEVFMIFKLAKVYGCELNQIGIFAFLSALGGAFIGQFFAMLIPFPPLQVPIGVGVTYGVGKAAQTWFVEGMPSVDLERYKEVFEEAVTGAKVQVKDFIEHPLKNIPLGDEQKKFHF